MSVDNNTIDILKISLVPKWYSYTFAKYLHHKVDSRPGLVIGVYDGISEV